MRVLTTRTELAAALAGSTSRRAVVMTMGALHDGHLSLVRQARELADQVVVTIFVNPLQFGPTEDLDRYPRDLTGDVAKLAEAGADLVFAPSTDEVYPRPVVVSVDAGRLGDVLEGEFRPGHMGGALTVVLKLLHLTRPDVAIFGEKDAQQLASIRRMVADLDLDVEVVGVPIVRESDGLAMSSRNVYLNAADRSVALALPRALAAGRTSAEQGGDSAQVLAAAAAVLDTAAIEVDYLAIVDDEFEPVESGFNGSALLLVAGRVGGVRLIDNARIVLRSTAGELR
jgi:pantoate--beta-alanine ligase